MGRALNTKIHNQDLGLFASGSGVTASFNQAITALNQNLSGYACPDFNYQAYITSVTLGATSHTIEYRIISGLNGDTANISYGDGRVVVPKGSSITVPMNCFIKEGAVQVNIMRIFDGTMTELTPSGGSPITVSGTFMATGTLFPIDFDDTAPVKSLFIGDSITRAMTGITSIKDAWTWQTRNNLRKNGERTTIQVNGHSGTNSLYHLNLQRIGKYDFPDLSKIFILLGTNDAAQAVSSATFISQMTEFIEYFADTMPNTDIYVLGVTPTDNNTWHALMVDYRADLDTLVNTTINNPKVHFIDLGDSFDRTTLSFYASSDTVGSKIHLSSTGNAAVSANLFAKYQLL